MNRRIIRILAFALCLVLVLSFATSCKKTVVAMEYEGKTITANMYSYWLSQIKSSYVSAANDTDAYWDTKYSNGQTYEEKMREIVDFNVKVNLICIKMFDDLGLEFTKEEKEELETSLSDLVQSFGSKSELNATLANYNINYKMLKQIYEIELKTTKVYDTLYASEALRKIDDETLDKYYKDNYSRMDIIMIYDRIVYEKDDKGELVFDKTTGTYKTKTLTDAESKAKNALADDILKKLEAGEDFDKLKEQYNEDPQSELFKDGYFISANDLSVYGSEIVLASQDMAVGDFKKTDDGTVICIMKKKELTEKPYTDENYKNQFSKLLDYCEQADFNKLMEELAEDVKVTKEELDKISIRDAALINY